MSSSVCRHGRASSPQLLDGEFAPDPVSHASSSSLWRCSATIRGLENQQIRSTALTLVTAAIILFNCRYLQCAVAELQRRGSAPDPSLLSHLSPLGWDRINLTGDYVWSDRIEVDDEGLMPLLQATQP